MRTVGLASLLVLACEGGAGDLDLEVRPDAVPADASADARRRSTPDVAPLPPAPLPHSCVDRDGDGFGERCPAGPDCDDGRGAAHVGAVELCGDGGDEDCDGAVDEGCGCADGESRTCYPGPSATAGVGACHAGHQRCTGGVLGPCEGPRTPRAEICDDADDDCDGEIDEGTRNRCGGCGPEPAERCNAADDDCDGATDEGVRNACGACGPAPLEYCDSADNDCDGEVDESCSCLADVASPCYTGPVATAGVGRCRPGYAVCLGGEVLACAQQEVPAVEVCDGVDDDCDGATDEGVKDACGGCGAAPAERCDGRGTDEDCDGRIDEGCGGCDGRRAQNCYGGPPDTLGVGRCHGGRADCEGGAWGVCAGEVRPAEEVCDGASDEDCDGRIDEGCDARCEPVAEACDGRDEDCDGVVDEGLRGLCGCRPEDAEEICGDGLDDDCDGRADEGCACRKGDRAPCYLGPPESRGVAACRDGEMVCADDSRYGACAGWVGPRFEVCNRVDDDCDGRIDEQPADGNACGRCGAAPDEVCDGLDQDCDGRVDEGLTNACGGCGAAPAEDCNGVDDDCDELTDEGLLNHCGTCGQSCFVRVFDDAGDWAQGEAFKLRAADAEPDALTLAEGEQLADPVLWISATTNQEVVKIDTRTCEVLGFFPTLGWSPSRTAVAVDGTVWIGNRGCRDNLSGCDGGNPAHGNAVHLAADGTPLCRAEITGADGGIAVRAVALDQDGHAWLGSWDRETIYKVHGTEVRPGEGIDEVPACRILREIPLRGPPYGAAVDARGFL